MLNGQPDLDGTGEQETGGQEETQETGGQETGGQQEQQNDDFPKWMAQTAGENKTNPKLKEFKTIDELANRFMTLSEEYEKAKSGIKVPGEDATEEEKKAFLKALGVPSDVKEYKKVDSELPKGIELREEQFEALKEYALKAGMTQKQFESVQKWYADAAKKEYEETAKRISEEKEKTEAHFKNIWGDQYDANVKLMQRGIKALGGDKLMHKLNVTGIGNDPDVISFLVEKGRQESGEPLLDGTGGKSKQNDGMLHYPSMEGM